MSDLSKGSSNKVRLALAALFVVLVTLTSLSIYRFTQIERRLDVTVSENVLWAAAQTEIELGRFLTIMADAAADPDKVPRTRVEERFDILWSRVSLYKEGVLARSLADTPELRKTVDDLFDDLKFIEPVISGRLVPSEVAAARVKIARHIEALRHVTTAALNSDRAERHALAKTHLEIRRELTVLVSSTLVVLAAFLIYLFLSERRARHHLRASVTARMEADAAWRQLDEAIENINEGFVLFDAEDRLVRCNRKYRELYAMSADVLIEGTTFEALIRHGAGNGQYRDALRNPEAWIEERMRKRQNITEPFEQQLSDGRWLMISDRQTSDGRRVGIRTDITELKRHMADLESARVHLRNQTERMAALAVENRQAHEVLNDAIESIGEGFVLYDADDRLVMCNSRYRSFFSRMKRRLKPGLPFDDFIKLAIETGHLVVGDNTEAAIAERKRRRRKENSAIFIEALADGRWLQVSNHMTLNGGVVTVFNDITELKKREMALIEARNGLQEQAVRMKSLMEMAEAASRSKSDFLAMISHEIRTPMNAVLGLANLLSDTDLTAEQARFVQGIDEAGVHLLGLINDILDFSRLEAEKADLQIAPVSIRNVINSSHSIVSVLAKKKNLALYVDIDPALPDGIMSDAARLNQILINLVGNAIKFTAEGEVRIRAELIATANETVGLRILVSDTGIGIPADMRKRIFQPFERSHANDREQISGTGLGLAITHRLITLMGGKIRLIEPEGRGTTFEIEMTCRRASGDDMPAIAEPVDPKPQADTAPARPMRILVAEDTPASQLVIKTMLERRGHAVVVVDNGKAAVHAASTQGFDLLLLDIQMPVMTGYEAAEAIRAMPLPMGAVPIVAVSAQAFATDRARAIQAGFNETLPKPIRPGDLDRLLQRAGAGEFSLPEIVAVDAEHESEMLKELLDMCGPTVFHSLLDVATANIHTEKAALMEAVTDGRADIARKIAHKLAGILGQYGSKQAFDAASKLEFAADDALATGAGSLGILIDATIDEMGRWRAKLAA